MSREVDAPKDEQHGTADHAAQRRRLTAALFATGLSDRTAFRRVYRMTSPKLFGICLRICGERQAAEDVLQEVYLLVWRHAPTFEPFRASPITWLSTIARNRALDWRRATGRPPPEPMPDFDLRPAAEPADPALPADAIMLLDEDAARVRACLDMLDERSRAAIRAAFLDGHSYPELARRAGIPVPTMKSTIRRGLLTMRKCLDDADDE